MNANIRKIISLFFLPLVFLSCPEKSTNIDCVPTSQINVSIDISLASYQALQVNGGWIYYSGNLAGTRGLIVVNTGSGYKAYDRNAPHICPGSNTTLIVKDDILIKCPSDGAEWILSTGQPVSIASRSPYSYYTSINGNILRITN